MGTPTSLSLSHKPGSSPSTRKPPSLPAPLPSTERWLGRVAEWVLIELASSVPHSKARLALPSQPKLVSKPAPEAGAEPPDSHMDVPPGPRNPTCHEGLDRLPSIRASEGPGPGSLLLSPWLTWEGPGEGENVRPPHVVRVAHVPSASSGPG